MEKISRIIPPSKREVWQSGEIEKPRRVADPVPGEDFFPKPVSSVQSGGEMAAQSEKVNSGRGFYRVG